MRGYSLKEDIKDAMTISAIILATLLVIGLVILAVYGVYTVYPALSETAQIIVMYIPAMILFAGAAAAIISMTGRPRLFAAVFFVWIVLFACLGVRISNAASVM